MRRPQFCAACRRWTHTCDACGLSMDAPEVAHLRAENAALLARAEEAERECAELRRDRDAALSGNRQYCRMLDERPAITPEMARAVIRRDDLDWSTTEERDAIEEAAERAYDALREHAKGAKS